MTVKFLDRKSALKQKNKAACEKILLFVMKYHLALPSLKYILMGKWHKVKKSGKKYRAMFFALI